MVEYILVVIFSVTLLFLAKGIFSGLNTFMTSYVGGYFKCLMVQGELPALSVTDADLSKHTAAGYKCSIKYDKPTIAPTSAGSGTKNIGTTNSLTTSKGSTKATASRRTGAQSSSSASKNKPKTRLSSINNGQGDNERFSDNVNNRSGEYSSSDSDSYDGIQSVRMAGKTKLDEAPGKKRTITGLQAEKILKNTRGGLDPSNGPRITAFALDEYRPGPRRNKLNPPTRAIAAISDEQDEPFTFGHFLKWVFIAGIVIALVVFFGGQVLNYSKSDSG